MEVNFYRFLIKSEIQGVTAVLWLDRPGISKAYNAGMTQSLRVLPLPRSFTVPLKLYNITKGVSLLGN